MCGLHTLADKVNLLAVLAVLCRGRDAVVDSLLLVSNALQTGVVAEEELLLSALRVAVVACAESRASSLRAHLLASNAALAAIGVLVDQLDEWCAAAGSGDDGGDAFGGVEGGLVDIEAALIFLVLVRVPEDQLAVGVPGRGVEGFACVLARRGEEGMGG